MLRIVAGTRQEGAKLCCRPLGLCHNKNGRGTVVHMLLNLVQYLEQQIPLWGLFQHKLHCPLICFVPKTSSRFTKNHVGRVC